jgi:hypothetical protein
MKVMINEDQKNPQQDQNVKKSAQYENTPQNVIYNATRFNKQFLDSQLGGNPATVSIGRMYVTAVLLYIPANSLS